MTGDAGNDVITVGSALSNSNIATFDLGDGNDILNLGKFANFVTVANVETINGGALNDTVYLSGDTGSGR